MAQFKKRLDDILFLDIETAAVRSNYQKLTNPMQNLWTHKAKLIARRNDLKVDDIAQLYLDKAAIYSEFAKVVCISVGFFDIDKKSLKSFRVKSFHGDDEKDILKEFNVLLKAHFDKPKRQAICGHNVKEFDIPFLARRMVIHKLKVPKMLDISGKKPWQVDHLLDTLQLWKFGDFKHYTSLSLLAEVLDIPTPKDDIDGSQIHNVYWEQKDIERIVTYCEKDVFTVAKVYLRLKYIDYPENLDLISKTLH